VIVIIFKEGPEKIDPTIFRSQFNHIFVIVSKMDYKSFTDQTYYRVEIVIKPTVPTFPPFLPNPPVFLKDDKFKNYILSKLVNGEQAALQSAKSFSNNLKKVRDKLLEDIISGAKSIKSAKVAKMQKPKSKLLEEKEKEQENNETPESKNELKTSKKKELKEKSGGGDIEIIKKQKKKKSGTMKVKRSSDFKTKKENVEGETKVKSQRGNKDKEIESLDDEKLSKKNVDFSDSGKRGSVLTNNYLVKSSTVKITRLEEKELFLINLPPEELLPVYSENVKTTKNDDI